MQSWVPKNYQLEAAKFMVSRGVAGLFLDPGLGKTSVTLAAFASLKKQGYVGRMLVIAPLRVCYSVWPNEIKKWSQFAGLRIAILHGPNKNARARLNYDVFVVNPEAFSTGKGGSWYENYAAEYVQADMLVVDESTKFKNSQSKRFKSLKNLLGNFKRRYILTGTPVANGLEDLFGQIYLLDRGVALGAYISHFRREHYQPKSSWGGYSEWELKEGHESLILDKIAPFCLRMSSDDYLELPELVENVVSVPIPDTLRKSYEVLEKDFITKIGELDVEAFNSAALSIKLRQICNGGVYGEDGTPIHVHGAKCDALESIVEEAGKPVLCAYQFVHDVHRIREHFGYEVPYIGGGVSERRASELIDDFNAGKIPLLLAHPASAGHGLNLQEQSNHVVFFGLPWSLEEYDQFIRRVHRQGNPNSHVFLHILLIENTLEQGMAKALSSKDRTQKAFFSAIKDYYTQPMTSPTMPVTSVSAS
jgi:SNF2 family DNA or RNA helicase